MRRRSAALLFLLTLLAGYVPVLPSPLAPGAPLVGPAAAAGGCADPRNSSIYRPPKPTPTDGSYHIPTGYSKSAVTGGLAIGLVDGAGERDAEKHCDTSGGTTPFEDTTIRSLCVFGGNYSLAHPRNDPPDGSAVPSGPLNGAAWLDRIHKTMLDRTYLSFRENDSVRPMSPLWGLGGLGDIYREIMSLRIPKWDPATGTVPASEPAWMAINPKASGELNNQGAWHGPALDGALDNSFKGDFNRAGAVFGAVATDPDPKIQMKRTALSVDIEDDGAHMIYLPYFAWAVKSSVASGVAAEPLVGTQRYWMKDNVLLKSSPKSGSGSSADFPPMSTFTDGWSTNYMSGMGMYTISDPWMALGQLMSSTSSLGGVAVKTYVMSTNSMTWKYNISKWTSSTTSFDVNTLTYTLTSNSWSTGETVHKTTIKVGVTITSTETLYATGASYKDWFWQFDHSTSRTDTYSTTAGAGRDGEMRYSQKVGYKFFDPVSIVGGMGRLDGIDGPDPYELVAPVKGQAMKDPTWLTGNALPVGPVVVAKASQGKSLGFYEGETNLPIDLYFKVYRHSEFITNAKTFYYSETQTIIEPTNSADVRAPRLFIQGGTIAGPFGSTPGTGEWRVSAAGYTEPPTITTIFENLYAAARIYWTSRGALRAGPWLDPAVYTETVRKDLEDATRRSAYKKWDAHGPPAVKWASIDDRGMTDMSQQKYKTLVYYPMLASPRLSSAAGGSYVLKDGGLGISDARASGCGDERSTFLPAHWSYSLVGWSWTIQEDPGVMIQPGGKSHEQFPRGMVDGADGCDLMSGMPEFPQHCWFTWRAWRIAVPEGDPPMTQLFLAEAKFMRGDHTGATTEGREGLDVLKVPADPTKINLPAGACGGSATGCDKKIFRRIDRPATLGQPYTIRFAPNPAAPAEPIQPQAYWNYGYDSWRFGSVFMNGTQVGLTFELGDPTNGGRILEVVRKGDATKKRFKFVDRSMLTADRDALKMRDENGVYDLEIDLLFDQTPASYLQSHPACMRKTPEKLLADCGIGYDPDSRTYYYQVRIRTWWEVMWGNDPIDRSVTPNEGADPIIAYGLYWMGATDKGKFWTKDRALAKAAVRPFGDSHIYTSLTKQNRLGYTRWADAGIEPADGFFLQTAPRVGDKTGNGGTDWLWACHETKTCPAKGNASLRDATMRTNAIMGGNQLTVIGEDTITEGPLAATDPRRLMKPNYRPGWGTYDFGNNRNANWGFMPRDYSWRPLFDASLSCSDKPNAYTIFKQPPFNSAAAVDQPNADCLFNIPVLQIQRSAGPVADSISPPVIPTPAPKSYPAPVIGTSSIETAYVGEPYRAEFYLSAGAPGGTWQLISGTLPPTLSLAGSGVITGTPISGDIGTYPFTIQYTVDGKSDNQSYTLQVKALPDLRIIAPDPVPDATASEVALIDLGAVGGTAPYAWSLVSGPAWLSIDAESGMISGYAPAVASATSYTIKARVSDASSPARSAEVDLNLTVKPSVPQIATVSLLPAVRGKAYSFSLAAYAGTTPYAWSATGLPGGFSIGSATGLLTSAGNVTTALGTYPVTIEVRSPHGASSTQNYDLRVVDPVSIATANLPAATSGSAYSFTLAAAGGVPPYRWSTSSPLPLGISLTATGILSGTSRQAGSFPLTIEVRDASGDTASRPLLLTLTAPTLAITTTSLPDGNYRLPYAAQLTATGVAPFTWSLASGSLPNGLSLDSDGVIRGTPNNSGGSTFTVSLRDSLDPLRPAVTKAFTIAVTSPTYRLAYLGAKYGIWSGTTYSARVRLVRQIDGSPVVGETIQYTACNTNAPWTSSASPTNASGEVSWTISPFPASGDCTLQIRFTGAGGTSITQVITGRAISSPCANSYYLIYTGDHGATFGTTPSFTMDLRSYVTTCPTGAQNVGFTVRSGSTIVATGSANTSGTSLSTGSRTATWSGWSPSAAGTYTVEASWNGYQSVPVLFTVAKALTTLTWDPAGSTTVYDGAPFVPAFILKTQAGSALAGQSVAITFGPDTKTVTTGPAGRAAWTFPLPASYGTYLVSALYAGTLDRYEGSSAGTAIIYAKSPSTLTNLTLPRVPPGDEFSPTAKLTDANGPITGAVLSFLIGSDPTPRTAITDSTGVAALLPPITYTVSQEGVYSLRVTYAGNATRAAAQLDASFQVYRDQPTIALVYTDPTLVSSGWQPRVILTNNGAPIEGRTVTLTVDANPPISLTTDENGVALTPTSMMSRATAGTGTISAAFAGDPTYLPASVTQPVTYQINPELIYSNPSSFNRYSTSTAVSGYFRINGIGIAGRKLTFTLSNGTASRSCTTGTTNASGWASCSMNLAGSGTLPASGWDWVWPTGWEFYDYKMTTSYAYDPAAPTYAARKIVSDVTVY